MEFKIVKLKDIVENLNMKRKPLNQLERSQKKEGKLYPYCGANGILDYINDYMFDEEILCIAEDGGKWGKNEKSTYIMNEPCWVNNHAHVVKAKENVYIKYLYYYLNYKDLSKYVTGTTRGKINRKSLGKINIKLPNKRDQLKIIKILDLIDDLKQKRKQQIEALSALKQSIFVDMFGTVKTNNYSFKKSKLGDFALLVTSGSTPKGGSESYLKEGVPLIRSQNVLWNELRLEDVVFISEETHKNMKRSQLNNRDVLLNITGASIGRSVVYRGADFEANVNQHVCIIRLNEYINPYYLSYYFANEEFQKNVVNKNIGATRQAFNYTQIKNFDILVPDLSLQNTFEDKVKQVDKQIDLLSNSLEQVNLLYDSILHKAFNGEIFKEGMKV